MTKKPQYKDAVFRKYFWNKTRILSLYKAVSGEENISEDDIELTDLESVYDNGKKNDVSFLYKNQLIVMFEHQSTVNENMPVRFLLYLARYYDKIIKSHDRYKRKRFPLPEPKFYVFYNGNDNSPNKQVMRLSEAFPAKSQKWIDLKLLCYNIKYKPNKALLRKCSAIMEYSIFVKKVEEFDNGDTNVAVQKAVDYCIQHDVMKEFMKKHREEVSDMFTEEWDLDKAIEVRAEEERKEALSKGLTKGRNDTLIELVRDKVISIADAAKRAGVSEAKFAAML